MTEQAIKLMSEIRQFREQYVAEVGKGRRVWPKSIRSRIEELENLKVPTKLIASQTGVAYDTILQWRVTVDSGNLKRDCSVIETFQETPADLPVPTR